MEEKIIKVHTREELNNVPKDFNGTIEIWGDKDHRIKIDEETPGEKIIGRGNSVIIVYGRAVSVYDNCLVFGHMRSLIRAYNESYVKAYNTTEVCSYDNSLIELYGYANAIAKDHCTLVMQEDSSAFVYNYCRVIAHDHSMVECRDACNIDAYDNSFIWLGDDCFANLFNNSYVKICSDNVKYKINNQAKIIDLYDTIDDYLKSYNVKDNGDTLILYKAVCHKNGRYFSNFDRKFEYVIGEKAYENNINLSTKEVCGKGLHIAPLDWVLPGCMVYYNDWAILECEVPKDKIVLPRFTDGKVRTSELTVLREVPLEECGTMGKMMLRKRELLGS